MPHTGIFFLHNVKESFGEMLTMHHLPRQTVQICKDFSLVVTFDLRGSLELLLLELLLLELLLLELLLWGEFWLLF